MSLFWPIISVTRRHSDFLFIVSVFCSALCDYIYIYIYIFVTRRHNDFVCIVSVFYSALCDRYDLQSRSQNDRKWKNGRMLKPLIIVFNRVLEVKTKETQLSIIDTQGEVKLKTGNLLEARKSERSARNLFQFLFDWLRWWWCTSSRTIT